MISLEQVKQLDIRVKKAVTAVKTLSAENSELRQQVVELEAQLEGLHREASNRKADEEQLELSLQNVIDVLDEMDSATSSVESEDSAENYAVEPVADPEPDTIFAQTELLESENPEETTDADIVDESEAEVPVEAVDESEAEVPVEAADSGIQEETKIIEESDEVVEEPEVINLDSNNNDKIQSEFDIF